MKYIDLLDAQNAGFVGKNNIPIINNLMAKNPLMEDANIMPCNKGMEHVISVLTGLSKIAWGMLYKGTPTSKGSRAQRKESTGFMEGKTQVDTRLLDLCSDSDGRKQLRNDEAAIMSEAIGQEYMRKFFYGSLKNDPEQIRGMSDRFGVIESGIRGQVIDAGGTGADNTSIWFIGWGNTKTSIIYPNGNGIVAGVKREDKGEQKEFDEDGNSYYVKEEMFTQHMGISVANYRHVVRIANIDVTEMQAGNVDLYALMRKAYFRLGDRKGDYKIYCNTDVLEALDAAAANADSGDNFTRLRYKELANQEEVVMYRSMQLRELDPYILLNTEGQVPTV